MKRLVSGIKPTGELHIGNYLGAIKQWVELQNDYDAFFFVADYHALTIRPDPGELKRLTYHVIAMLISLGIDPKSSTLFVQSQIPEHAELSWFLANYTSVGELMRMTQYKEKADQYGQNVGLFTYPVLMAADVLIYQAQAVPVGEDQVQHLELAREVARRLNHRYGNIFTEPKPILNQAARIMALNNPEKKMSKSIPGSAIGLLDDEATVTATIKRSVTDSDPNSAELSPGVANLFTLLEGFSSREIYLSFDKQSKNGALRYSELKEQLIEDVLAFLRPVQKTYRSLIENEEQLLKIAEEGAKKARPIAQETLKKTREKLGLIG